MNYSCMNCCVIFCCLWPEHISHRGRSRKLKWTFYFSNRGPCLLFGAKCFSQSAVNRWENEPCSPQRSRICGVCSEHRAAYYGLTHTEEVVTSAICSFFFCVSLILCIVSMHWASPPMWKFTWLHVPLAVKETCPLSERVAWVALNDRYCWCHYFSIPCRAYVYSCHTLRMTRASLWFHVSREVPWLS